MIPIPCLAASINQQHCHDVSLPLEVIGMMISSQENGAAPAPCWPGGWQQLQWNKLATGAGIPEHVLYSSRSARACLGHL